MSELPTLKEIEAGERPTQEAACYKCFWARDGHGKKVVVKEIASGSVSPDWEPLATLSELRKDPFVTAPVTDMCFRCSWVMDESGNLIVAQLTDENGWVEYQPPRRQPEVETTSPEKPPPPEAVGVCLVMGVVLAVGLVTKLLEMVFSDREGLLEVWAAVIENLTGLESARRGWGGCLLFWILPGFLACCPVSAFAVVLVRWLFQNGPAPDPVGTVVVFGGSGLLFLVYNKLVERIPDDYFDEEVNDASETERTTAPIVTPEPLPEEWVYILQNPAFPQKLKIGRTSRTPEIRARELSGTGLPEEYSVIAKFRTNASERVERRVHRRLKAYRTNDAREFFAVSPSKAKEMIQICIAEVRGG